MNDQIEAHQRAVEQLKDGIPVLERICARIINCFEAGGKLFVMGNGGSAADAQHIAAELLGRFKVDRRALPAIALTTDTSTLTAVGNDFGNDVIFSRQIEGLVQTNDVVWALSVSGSSPNIIAGVNAAKTAGAFVIGFTGSDGDELAGLCDEHLRAAHRDADRVQEVHELAYHLICERIEAAFVQVATADRSHLA
ncbi:MAG: SIS domain-containing protein [Planctomycetes bacterium]|nr:SIS domain-containing protein [Planctomycetota bacterium]